MSEFQGLVFRVLTFEVGLTARQGHGLQRMVSAVHFMLAEATRNWILVI